MAGFTQIVIAKIQGTKATAAAKGAAGKTFVIADVTTRGGGLGNTVVLKPVGAAAKATAATKAAGAAKVAGAGTGAGSVTLKLEGLKQATGLKPMIGKTFTVGKAPMGSKVLILDPNTATALKAAAAGGMKTGGTAAAIKLEGAKQVTTLKGLLGKTFIVADSGGKSTLMLKPAAGAVKTAGAAKAAGATKAAGAGKGMIAVKLAGKNQALAAKGLVGKQVTLDAPLLVGKGGAGKWLALKTVPGVGGKIAAGTTSAKGAAVAKTVAAPQIALAAKAIGAKGAAASGTLWSGTGMSLGLGIGLGALGPTLIGAAAAYGGYKLYKWQKGVIDAKDEQDALKAELAI
jgi:hypothetical protein